MRHACVDASVVVKWFKPQGEADRDHARSLRRAFEQGDLTIVAPSLLPLELLNTLGRRWNWPADDLRSLVVAFADLELQLLEPDLTAVAEWVLRGLTAYDAAYLAVSEERGYPLITADERVLAAAEGVAVHVASF